MPASAFAGRTAAETQIIHLTGAVLAGNPLLAYNGDTATYQAGEIPRRSAAQPSQWEQLPQNGVNAEADGDTAHRFTFGSAPGVLPFVMRYDTTGMEQFMAIDIVRDTAGTEQGTIAAGWSTFLNAPDEDAWIMRLGSDGKALWQRRIGEHTANERGVAVRQAFSYDATGRKSPDGFWAVWQRAQGSDTDLVISRLDEQGNERWTVRYGDTQFNEFVTALEPLITVNNGILLSDGALLAGYRVKTNESKEQAFLLHVTETGEFERGFVSTSAALNRFDAVRQLRDQDGLPSGVIAAGKDGASLWVVKLDAQWQEKWSTLYASGQALYATAIEPVASGYIVAGTQVNAGNLTSFGAIVKLDANGAPAFGTTYSTTLTNGKIDLLDLRCLKTEGALFATGRVSSGVGTQVRHYALNLRVRDANGFALEWARVLPGALSTDVAVAMEITRQGFVAAGKTNSSDALAFALAADGTCGNCQAIKNFLLLMNTPSPLALGTPAQASKLANQSFEKYQGVFAEQNSPENPEQAICQAGAPLLRVTQNATEQRAPEVDLPWLKRDIQRHAGSEIPAGGAYDVPPVPVDAAHPNPTATVTFTVTNVGTGTQTLFNPAVIVSGNDQFQVVEPIPAPVGGALAPGESFQFQIQYQPALNVISNDATVTLQQPDPANPALAKPIMTFTVLGNQAVQVTTREDQNDTGSGVITITGRQDNCQQAACEIAEGATLAFRAEPADDSVFTGWTINGNPMGFSDANGDFIMTMTENMTVQAQFTRKQYVVSGRVATAAQNGVAGVALTYEIDGQQQQTVTDAQGFYTIVVPHNWNGTVTPNLAGFNFAPVSRPYNTQQDPPIIADRLTQNFAAQPAGQARIGGIILDLDGLPIQGVLVTASLADGGSATATTGADGSYELFVPDGWSGTVTPTFEGYTFNPPSSAFADVVEDQTANYTGSSSSVSILTVTTSGFGVVTSDPAGIDCGETCHAAYANGATVTLTATPDDGSVFVGWEGGGCAGTDACAFTMAENISVTATFQSGAALTIMKAGDGGGNVSSSPAGIACGETCQNIYAIGAEVTLTATPDAASVFTGWEGGGCSGTGLCQITLQNQTTVTARFDIPTLQVTVNGTGSGTVTSAPAGITCGADCAEAYPPNTRVTLTATAASGSVFTGWSGACAGVGVCTISMTAQTSVTATFQPTRTIVGYVRNSGVTGIANVTMAGVPGAPVTNANGLYTAVVPLDWSGAVRPQRDGFAFTPVERVYSAVQTNLTAQNYTAVRQYALTVALIGAGTGRVTSSPGGIACGSDCAEIYNTDTVVTLTATPAVGSKLSAWSGGGCSGAGACKVTVNAAKTVTATFVPATVTLSGFVRNSASTGLAGVVMSGLPGNPVTGTNGAYSVTLPRGWSGVVTPQKAGYAVTPVSRSYTSVVANATGQNYTWKQATVSAIRALRSQMTFAPFSNLSTLPPVVPSDLGETPTPAAVPEPTMLGLMGFGLAGLVYLLWWSRQR